MKIGIATVGRFHVLDLARELSDSGHEVTLYAALTKKRVKKFGLEERCLKSYLWAVAPFLFMERILKGRAQKKLKTFRSVVSDFVVSFLIRDCDVFISMSGIFTRAPQVAKKKFKSLIFIERGSQHILSQNEILKSINSKETASNFMTRRELVCYKIADRISIPSDVVKQTFIANGAEPDRLFVNPYGVDFKNFSPISRKVSGHKDSTAIFVGRWGLRKGADIVESTVETTGISLIHVGTLEDLPFPKDERGFTSFGPVDQSQLPSFYNQADFLFLPSREEGLSLVQAQALACGIPVLCSEFTGGRDIKALIQHPRAIVEVDIANQKSVLEGVDRIIQISKDYAGFDLLGDVGRTNLSWKGYGERYDTYLNAMVQKNIY